MLGTIGVLLHDRFKELGWLSGGSTNGDNSYALTADGTKAFEALGIDLEATGAQSNSCQMSKPTDQSHRHLSDPPVHVDAEKSEVWGQPVKIPSYFANSLCLVFT
jgi:hypothetical protein